MEAILFIHYMQNIATVYVQKWTHFFMILTNIKVLLNSIHHCGYFENGFVLIILLKMD
jgi:hypothetical protein